MRRDAEYWRKKAEKYQRGIENNFLYEYITTRTVLRRGVLVREGEGANTNEYFVTRLEFKYGRRAGNFRRKGSFKLFRTVWYVVSVSNHQHHPECRIQHWNHLIMAQAHRDGRNYHYAKYLMTGSKY